jgi:hypothetical protein
MIYSSFIVFLFSSFLFSQSFSTKGQFWVGGLTGNDVPAGQSAFESTIGYIPTLSLSKNNSELSFIDFEWAYRLDRSYSGDTLVSNQEKNHRLWIRYSSEKIEARLGLQKIVFGPSQILRTLSWFDSFDLTDPTGQTHGVDAFRLRWFPNNSISIWSWIIQGKNELSFGSRTEISNSLGEWGLTTHRDSETHGRNLGQMPLLISGTNYRFALDYRYDGFIGFWNESSIVYLDDSELGFMTIGADFTLPVANGILVMTETIFMNNSATNTNETLTAFMANLPLGMVHQIMLISQVDWETNHWNHFIRWGSTFDKFSLNFILSKSPKRTDYAIPSEYLPNTVAGFGTGLQFMFIYNH